MSLGGAGNVWKDGGKQRKNGAKRIIGLEISLYQKTNATTRVLGGRWEGTFALRYGKPLQKGRKSGTKARLCEVS